MLGLGSWSGPWPLSEAAHSCPESTLGLSSARMANCHGRVELWCEGSDQ